jgi:hypothetical protein
MALRLIGEARGDVGRADDANGERRGLRRLTIGVSEDDLRVIAEHGYEGAASATTISAACSVCAGKW